MGSAPRADAHGSNKWRPAGCSRSLRRFKVQFQCLLQVSQRFFLGFPLAGNIDFEALRDVPVSFPPNRCRKRTFHDAILAQDADVPTPDPADGMCLATNVGCGFTD